MTAVCGAAIAHGCAGAAEHMEVRERPLHTDVQVPRSTWQGLLLQSFCISAIHGGQMQDVRLQGRRR